MSSLFKYPVCTWAYHNNCPKVFIEKNLQRSLLRNLSLFTVHNALRRASIKRCFRSAMSPTGVFPGPSLVGGTMTLCQGPAPLKGCLWRHNSSQLNWPSWTAYSQVSRVFVYDVTTYKLSQLLFTLSSWVQLSWVVSLWTGLYALQR